MHSSRLLTIVHLCTWFVTALLIVAWLQSELRDAASDSANILSYVHLMATLPIVAMIAIHASFTLQREYVMTTLFTTTFVILLIVQNALGCVYIGYSLFLDSPSLLNASMVSQAFVSFASAMLITLYFKWWWSKNVE